MSVAPNTSFADRVRAIAWLVVLLALVGFALAALALSWDWPKVAIPAGMAVLMSLIAPGRSPNAHLR